MKRIIDLNGVFLRDDTEYDTETEIALDVEPAQGFILPRWDGTQWVEGGTAPEPIPYTPTESERLEALESAMLALMMGGGIDV